MTAVFAIDLKHAAEPIAQQVVQALRRAIVTMHIRPGEMLSEQDIATRLGISRQPVREAFIKLGKAGLVRILPQRGTLIVKISPAAVEDAHFVREAVECAIVREVARGADRAALAAIGANLAEQGRAARAKDPEVFFALDDAFHRLLADAAHRQAAWQIIEDIKPQMDRVRFLSMPDTSPMPALVDQHTAIAEAVMAGDPDAAAAAMRAHLGEILLTLPKLALLHPDLFDPLPPSDT
ncbi:MAG TPA: GntR family transcriptional regulator [Inquilinus sp.]|nr:GntR family transcriptional regulator [Inquilinus sp.]